MLARHHGERATESHRTKQFKISADIDQSGDGFDFMFAELADDPEKRLPESPDTISALRLLGEAMAADPSRREGVIPAMFTYFGQFIDHDITKTEMNSAMMDRSGRDIIETNNFSPLSRQSVIDNLTNARTPFLDLDNLYGGLAEEEATNADGSMQLSEVSKAPFGTIPSDDRFHDLPRRPLIENPSNMDEIRMDREALIGDPRNDENLLVAQLHLAMLRSHNVCINERGLGREEAITAIRRRYQWSVLQDFLARLCTASVFEKLQTEGPRFFKPKEDEVFMPVEFSGAAYRFGHSMVRGGYNHNATFSNEPFLRFFTFTALSGDISPFPGQSSQSETLPDNWMIDWERFFTQSNPSSFNPSRRIDTAITPALNEMPDFQGIPIQTVMGKLASRNLLRGYLLGLPTGQAVAEKTGAQLLTSNELLAELPVAARTSFNNAGFAEKTPLWFYILAEASVQEDGQRLGVVGSTIVGETLWSLVSLSKDSVLGDLPSDEELATGEFSLEGLIGMGRDQGIGQSQPTSMV